MNSTITQISLSMTKLKTSGRIGHSENVKMKPVFVVPVVDISWYTSFRAPVFVQKNYKKKFLCCNKINATLCIELEKAAFITGEKINVYGEIDNQHNSKPIKEGLVELVSVFRCRCKGAQKYSKMIVAHFVIPSVPPQSTTTFENVLQIPDGIFPTYSLTSVPINTSYHVAFSIDKCPKLEIPVVIGTKRPTMPLQPSVLPIAASSMSRKIPLKHSPPPQRQIHQAAQHYFPPPPSCPLPPCPPPLPSYLAAIHHVPYGYSPQNLNISQFTPTNLPFGNYSMNHEFSNAKQNETLYSGQSFLRIEEID